MIKSLWVKFFLLLLVVSVIALSAALVLRELMVRDFRAYIEGDQEDHVYTITADLEASYEKYGTWRRDAAEREAVRAFMLGIEARIFDAEGNLVVDSESALKALSPGARQRVHDLAALRSQTASGPFLAYPLFLKGKEIGRLEVKFPQPRREALFVKRSNLFLLASLGALGAYTILLSIAFARRLTRPLKELASATTAVSDADYSRRVAITTQDELGRLSQAFNHMAQKLETQESLRKKIISNVAHELRTPLSAIQGEIEGMMDGLIPTSKEQLQSLHDEANRLKKMLEGIDRLTRAQGTALTIKKQRIEIKPFLENILARMRKTLHVKGIVITLDCEDVSVLAEPDSLSEIVINLLSNAIKAVEDRGTITVAGSQKGTDFVLEVKDTGVGIKPEDQAFIFERFFKTGSGLGLGLAIVRELVDAHGGTITVESTLGAGSVFTVRLPG